MGAEIAAHCRAKPGFMKQLELWWEMGCPTQSDDAVEDQPMYQRWLYKQEVELSARVGKAPDWLRFEDEEERPSSGKSSLQGQGESHSARCKKCRRVLATGSFIVPHQGTGNQAQACPHVFIEPLSWMRPTLEAGELDGRLVCPNAKCGATIGRYSWQGFRCSCNEWVCPAFSLQRSKVDEVTTAGPRNVALGPGMWRRPPLAWRPWEFACRLGAAQAPPCPGLVALGRKENL